MATQPLLWGKDLEHELVDYMEQNQGEFYRHGGLAKSDAAPAMLILGESIVNRQAVVRYGASSSEAIDNLGAPAQALAGRALAGIRGFASGGLVQSASRSLSRPSLSESTSTHIVRVKLPSGQQEVNVTVDTHDETRLLRLLNAARARTARPYAPVSLPEGFPIQLKNFDTGMALPLPDDLLWSDEYAWPPVVANVSYLVTGILLIQSVTRQAGRPITLVGVPDMIWVTRTAIEQSRAWAAIPVDGSTGRLELTLTDGRVFTVAFRHAETAIEAEPALGIPARSGNSFYRLVLRSLEIA